MLYLRHDNRQSRYANTKDGKAKAFKDILTLGLAEFDIYDSDSRSLIFGAYRITSFAGNAGTEHFCKTLDQARRMYPSMRDADRVLVEHYDTSQRSWVTVYDSAAKAA